ncbi:methyltransferase domain-containing protein [Paenibacillus validus]|uniref:Methyltransferase domain-containing protein n=1 Tax=Paenibacillus validus TaxID=44253 RepID=A0A7X2ZCK0_9BACL|nr:MULTISPECIES: class I SAM-dependent methyltransferase [Paenibacillus]MED4602867.1 methyltransferase domain-containing protein [Paenibacillus validus]MED4606792.1 methyltransferase domain-containing protein [Paenibacillus validus]MUG72480.1 methyltransferase domain-containing protein [Paenibacillus validus]
MSDVFVSYRDSCRVCKSTNLKKWVHLPQMPMTDDLRKQVNKEVFLHDINIYVCLDCQVSQTLHDIDYGSYYKEYSYTVTKSGFANQFMQQLATNTIDKFNLKPGLKVVEVGSGDGSQLLEYKKLGANVFGFEPSELLTEISRQRGVPVYTGLFDNDASKYIPKEFSSADVILLTYTFDHIPNPVDFLLSVKDILNPDNGLLIIEVHDLDQIIAKREYCLFEHEHSVYLSLKTMEQLLKRCGYKLITDNLVPLQSRRGNSLLIVAANENSKITYESETQGVHQTLDDLNSFSNRLETGIKELDLFIEQEIKANKKIAGYGAGGRGVMTLAALNNAKYLKYLCDQNHNFHGKFTPKTNIPVVPTTFLSEQPVDTLIVFSYGYMDEISKHVNALPNPPKSIVSLLEVL